MDPIAKLTVADIQAVKGKRQLTEILVRTPDEAAACQAAGIDLLMVPGANWIPEIRTAAPGCFIICGIRYGQHVTEVDYLRAAFRFLQDGVDACYCAASNRIVAHLSAEGIPVVGHLGLVPAKRTWTGGYRAVGKTATTALKLYQDIKALENAGAFAVELEVVPERVATEIARRTSMIVFSLGSGPGCDAQYLFADDILGAHDGHYPRHAKIYRDFLTEYTRLQEDRIAAFTEYAADVATGGFPNADRLVLIDDDEFDTFIAGLENISPAVA